ncbi:MAG: Clp protease N-terminal domain-containing protein [Candidatus Dormibacteria bacterium]
MYPFDRFTEGSKQVWRLAQEEAERAHHSYIGTEHLLLGLLREGDGLAAKVLGNLGVEIDKVRTTIESALGRNERIIVQQIIPTSRVKKVIEIAFAEAKRGNDAQVGTEHLLLGLLIEGEGMAAHVLEDLGVSLETVRGQIAILKGREPAAGSMEEPPDEDPWDLLRRLHEQLHRGHPGGQEGWASSQSADSTLLASLLPPKVGAAARSALALAEEEATRVVAPQIGTEHLLLGLLRQREGGAARVLDELGVDLSRARAAASAPDSHPGPATSGGPPQAGAELVDALGRAHLRADGDGRWVETGDLLVAISQPGAGRASEILRRLGVVHLKLEEHVTLVIGEEPTG